MATSVGWAQGDSNETPTETTKLTQKNIDGKLCIFANGNPVTVTAAEPEQITITVDDSDDHLTVANTSNLFGGSYGKSVSSSTITMASGTIRRIYGGGYGIDANQNGDVTGTAAITISGGTITNILSGGGNQYAKTEKASIKITGTDTKVQCLYAGGVGYPATKKLVRTWDEAVCGTKDVEINITDATLTEGLGCGGGQGYTYTGTSTVTITNATLGSFYGVLANGYANDINATLTGCTFKKLVDNCYEFATINRGAVNNASFTFDGCTFESHNEMNAGVGPILGWDNSDTSGDPKPAIEGNITWKFINTNGDAPEMHLGPGLSNANVEVTGAKTKLIKFKQVKVDVTDFSIEKDKTWTLGNGLSIEDDVTFTNNGTLVVNGTLTISKVDQLAMALSSVTKGGIIDLLSVTSANMLSKLNEGDKKELTAGICILCSDATVYTDETSAQQSIVDGTIQYIKLDGGTYSLKEPEALTVAPTIKIKPTASTIEAGQPLSASILKGGEAKVTVKETEVVVNGVFSWKDPSAKATVDTKSYDVVFTPTDLTKYEVVNTQVEIKDIKQYYTVTIGKCDNGKIEVTNGNSAGKYEDKKVLSVKAIPNDHYDFSAWGTGITGDAINGSYTVSKNDVLTATFVAKEYKVTIGENVKVTKQDGTSISTGNLPYGSVLNVVAAPKGEVGSLKSLTCNDKEVINNTVTVDGALNIQATFNAVVPSTYRVSLGENVKNGKIQLFDKNGNAIAFGSALTEGTVISVVTVPDPGYELDGSATAEGATYENGKFTVAKAAVTVSATFKPKKYTVTTVAENATITLDKSGKQEYGTSIKITEAKAAADYKLLAVVVNGKEIAKDQSFIVKGDTKVNAVVQKLPEVVFTDVNQTYTYNKAAQAFVVRTVPAGISGITVTYKQGENAVQSPTDAGTYKVFATLAANASYASMDAKEIGTLTIEKAPYPAAIPTVGQIVTNNDNENEYHWRSEAVGNFRTAYYKLPSNSNYREPEFVIPSTSDLENNLTKVTLGEGSWVKTRSTTTTVSLTLNATGGSVSVWNGDVQVTNVTPLYAGQKLTLKAIPTDATYSTRPVWSDNVKVDKDGVASITLPDKDATVTATFATKDDAPLIPQNYTSIYTGTAFGIDAAPTVLSDVSGWVVSFEQEGVPVNEPTAVGNYTMKASRSEDDVYKATTVTVGILRITEAKAVISDVVGTDITTIQTLNQSVISGTANVEGTFSWVNPDTKLAAKDYTDIAVLFTPADNNYAPVTGKATVKVTALANNVAVRTIELTENDPVNGNGVVLTLNGTEVTAGTTVKTGDKLIATFSAKPDFTASAKINGASYASGNEYEVKDEDSNVSIAITYTQKSNPSPTPNPEPGDDVTYVTGISLDATSKTLAVGESFALKATVKPADADNKKVSWSSSDATIASVDKDGNVKALKAGTCKITATTEDGDYTATCVVTVTIATGIDEILTANRIYTDYRQIIVEPTTMLEVLISDLNGRIIYNGRTAEKISVSVSGGMYIVRLIDGKRVAATKVIVK